MGSRMSKIPRIINMKYLEETIRIFFSLVQRVGTIHDRNYAPLVGEEFPVKPKVSE